MNIHDTYKKNTQNVIDTNWDYNKTINIDYLPIFIKLALFIFISYIVTHPQIRNMELRNMVKMFRWIYKIIVISKN